MINAYTKNNTQLLPEYRNTILDTYLACPRDGDVEEVEPLGRPVLSLDVAAQEVHHHVRVVPQAVRQ